MPWQLPSGGYFNQVQCHREVRMRGCPLGKRDGFPLFDEFGGSHGPAIAGNSNRKNSLHLNLLDLYLYKLVPTTP